MSVMKYKGYTARVEFDDEDGIFFGRVAGIRDGVNFHGETVDELRAAFRDSVDGYIEVCARIGKSPEKPYSGQLMMRIDPAVHASVAKAAELAGSSVNKWAEAKLREAAEEAIGG